LSFQYNVIELAVKLPNRALLGAFGSGVKVVAHVSFEYPESPALLYARTRKQYCVPALNPVLV
jgi:hypothetical protein